MSYSTSQFNKTTLLRFWSELDLPCSARIVENVDNVENVRRSPSEQPRNMGSPTNGPDCIPVVHAWDRRCRKPMIRWNLAWRTRPSDRALGKVLMHFHLPRWKMLHWSKTTWYAVPSWTWTAFATAGLRVADVARCFQLHICDHLCSFVGDKVHFFKDSQLGCTGVSQNLHTFQLSQSQHRCIPKKPHHRKLHHDFLVVCDAVRW